MHSTSFLPLLTVGFRRAEMTAFWIMVLAVSSFALGLAALILGARAPWAWAAAGLSPALPGLVWPIWFEFGVRAWNKSVRLTVASLRSYVLKVCYYLLFGAVSRTGSSLDLQLRTPEFSRWIPRDPPGPTIGDPGPLVADPKGLRGPADNVRGGHGPLASIYNQRDAGKAWTVCLIPIMWLLRLLRDEEQDNLPPTNTYTLY